MNNYSIEQTANSKLLAEYLGWKYIGYSNSLPKDFFAGWYCQVFKPLDMELWKVLPKSGFKKLPDSSYGKYVCRNHAGLDFRCNYNRLFEVIEKLEKEDLSEYFDDDNFEGIEISRFTNDWSAFINLKYDPPLWLTEQNKSEVKEVEQLFLAVLSAVKYINDLRNG